MGVQYDWEEWHATANDTLRARLFGISGLVNEEVDLASRRRSASGKRRSLRSTLRTTLLEPRRSTGRRGVLGCGVDNDLAGDRRGSPCPFIFLFVAAAAFQLAGSSSALPLNLERGQMELNLDAS